MMFSWVLIRVTFNQFSITLRCSPADIVKRVVVLAA